MKTADQDHWDKVQNQVHVKDPMDDRQTDGSSSGLRQLWEPSLTEEPGMGPEFSSSWFLEEHTELSVDR